MDKQVYQQYNMVKYDTIQKESHYVDTISATTINLPQKP